MVQDQCKTGICRLHCVISTIIEIEVKIVICFDYTRNIFIKSNINKTLQLKFTVEKYIYLGALKLLGVGVPQ